MPNLQDLIEWDYWGAMTMIFEDVTNEKVTEMTIPSRKFPHFIKAVTAGHSPFNL